MLEVDLAIIIVIKQSDCDYRVNNVVKGVVTVSNHCVQHKVEIGVSPRANFEKY